jgi:hypothetical protein
MISVPDILCVCAAKVCRLIGAAASRRQPNGSRPCWR